MSQRKALGQHFLTQRQILEKIIRVIDPRQDETIFEVGPGRGALTFPLAARCAKLVAIEKDPALIPDLLAGKPGNVEIIEGDVLQTNLGELIRREAGPSAKAKVVGNLPYSISSPFLFKILDEGEPIALGVFLLQKEVAERVAAGPGSKKYAPVSILFRLDFEVRRHFEVAPASFSPPPRVRSTLISLTRRESPLFAVSNPGGFRRFLRAAFAERRKTLANNLKRLGLPAGVVGRALAGQSLAENVRAEQVEIGPFVALYAALRAAAPLPESAGGGIKQET